MALNPAERRGALLSLVPQEPRSEFSRRFDLVEQALNLSLNAVHVFRWDNPDNAAMRAAWADANYRQEAAQRRALWDSYHSTDRVKYSVTGSFIYKSSQVELEIEEMRRLAEAESQGLRAAGLNLANFPSSGLAFGERVPRLHLVGVSASADVTNSKMSESSKPEEPSDSDYTFRLTYVSGPVAGVVLKILGEYDSTGDVEPKVLEGMKRFVDGRNRLPDAQERWEIFTPKLDPDQMKLLDDSVMGRVSLAVPRYFSISAWDPSQKAIQTESWVRHTEEAKRPL